MLAKLLAHLRRQWMGALALFLVLTGGTAWAVDEWTGANIVNGSLTSADYKNNNIQSADVKDFSLGNGDFLTGSVDSRVVSNFSLGNGDFLTGSVDSRAATDNSLTGTDIDESSLNMPPTTTATFVGPSAPVNLSSSFTKVVGRNLPAGSYAIAATANLTGPVISGFDGDWDAVCELRNGAGFIGGATDRRRTNDGTHTAVSLSMNGGAQVPAGGGEVSLWCKYEFGSGSLAKVNYGQMMIIRVDGFF
jgi:hypothetical protein